MNTNREAILQAVVTRLGAALSTKVYRSRVQAFAKNELPAVVVKPGEEQATRLGNRVVQRVFNILIEVHARSSSIPGQEQSADQVADPIIAQLHATLFADKRLGGLLADLRDKQMQEPQYADGDETAIGITLEYEAVYATTETDITTLTNH